MAYKPVITLEPIIILRAFGDSISLRLPVYATILYKGNAFMIKGW